MDNSGYKKTQARVNLDIDVTSWLKVGTNINGYVSFTEQGTNKMEDVFTYAAATSPGMVFRAPDGRLGSSIMTRTMLRMQPIILFIVYIILREISKNGM